MKDRDIETSQVASRPRQYVCRVFRVGQKIISMVVVRI